MEKLSKNKISIIDFENMFAEDIIKFVNNSSANQIVELLLLIKEKRAIQWNDRAILQMVEKSPLTFWASDKSYQIVLWAGKCKDVYNRDLFGKSFPEIMSILERSDAMKDSISVIEAKQDELAPLLADFKNYYTKDMQGNQVKFSIVTNSMQLIDEDTGEKYYAEIGLPIDLESALDQYHKREEELKEKVNIILEKLKNIRNSFSIEISRFRQIIHKEEKLTRNQKSKLRKIISNYESEIEDNLQRYKLALNLDDFIHENEEAKEIAIEKIQIAINHEISQVPKPEVTNHNKNIEEIIKTIDNKIEIIRSTFDYEIKQSTESDINNDLEKDRKKFLFKLQEKRDEYIRELTEMKELIVSTTTVNLSKYQSRLDVIEDDMRNFINDIKK